MGWRETDSGVTKEKEHMINLMPKSMDLKNSEAI